MSDQTRRYEIRDNNNPSWRGQRFTSENRARRELSLAVGDPGRWSLVDRVTRKVLVTR
jgi:hypothetical protein